MSDLTAKADAEIQAKLLEARTHHQGGRLQLAWEAYQQVIALEPRHFDALHFAGQVAAQTGHFEYAIALIGRALEIDPNNAPALYNRGFSFAARGDHAAALECFDRVIQIKPDYAEAHNNRGVVLKALNRLREAGESFARATRVNSGFSEARYNHATVLLQLDQFQEAIENYDAFLRVNPSHAGAHYGKAMALRSLRRFDAALVSYDKVIELNADYAEAHNERGIVLMELRDNGRARESFDRAISLNADFANAYNNRGALWRNLGQLETALSDFDKAVQLKADFASAHVNRAAVLHKLRRYEEAARAYDSAIALEPNTRFLPALRFYTKASMCAWDDYDRDSQNLAEEIRNGTVVPPFSMLSLSASPLLVRKAAESWVQTTYPGDESLGAFRPRPRDGKIRLGYFSMDFRQHPVAILTAGLFEAHDRNKFDVYAFSYGPPAHDDMRRRLERAFDEFMDVEHKSDREIARLAREKGIEIAIDLAGLTGTARTGIFALRAAPIQVNYIGYPSTMGAAYIDYMVADDTVVPRHAQPHYTEKMAYLPCFQANDSKRVQPSTVFTRTELGLPPEGFVFCCFNYPHKITPATFDGWVRILKRVEGSVLFLYGDNDAAVANLRKEAASRGLARDRLVFGKRISVERYLARFRAADLFLDTIPFNGGTTASDALWAGLPVLTQMGEIFAGRMAASLLRAVGLPELVTNTQTEYEDLAVALAHDPARMIALRQRLAGNRLTKPLFNSARFAAHIEAAYTEMSKRHRAGLLPDHIYITDTP
jgi:predicted O-linked N-acetylglucosamine transferase (SPINDLY family)